MCQLCMSPSGLLAFVVFQKGTQASKTRSLQVHLINEGVKEEDHTTDLMPWEDPEAPRELMAPAMFCAA